jgi:hypothetical protein
MGAWRQDGLANWMSVVIQLQLSRTRLQVPTQLFPLEIANLSRWPAIVTSSI